MANIADYFAVSCSLNEASDTDGIAFIRNDNTGKRSQLFWPLKQLTAADSHQVIFENCIVNKDYVHVSNTEVIGNILGFGLAAFNLMVSAAYTGVSYRLVNNLPLERIDKSLIDLTFQAPLVSAHFSTVGLASALSTLNNVETLIDHILLNRYGLQRSLKHINLEAVENIGAWGYFSNKEVEYLMSVVNCLSFHPITVHGYKTLLSEKN